MNHTDKTDVTFNDVYSKLAMKKPMRNHSISIIIAMVLFSAVIFSGSVESISFFSLLLSAFAYFLTVYLFFGIAHLAHQQRTYLLWGGAIGAIIIGYLFSGLGNILDLILTWSTILFAGVITGRMNITQYRQTKIYLLGLSAVIFFSLIQMYPVWSDLIRLATENSQLMIEEVRQNLTTLGYSEEIIADNIAFFQNMTVVMIRLIPASMILGIMFQFTLGYILFLMRLDKEDGIFKRLKPYILWKMPFAFTPVLMLTIICRLLGNDQVQIVADNVLTVLSVYYCLTGLSVVEFYLKKLKISKFMKILFYVMLFFTQLVGYFVIIIVGFIDSFTDWRKVKTHEIIGMN